MIKLKFFPSEKAKAEFEKKKKLNRVNKRVSKMQKKLSLKIKLLEATTGQVLEVGKKLPPESSAQDWSEPFNSEEDQINT
jgi:hypothetical protein